MKEVGFTPSHYDPCMYYKKKVVMLIYIDDCLVFSSDPKLIDKISEISETQARILRLMTKVMPVTIWGLKLLTSTIAQSS